MRTKADWVLQVCMFFVLLTFRNLFPNFWYFFTYCACSSCLRALQNGDSEEFHAKLSQTKMVLFTATFVVTFTSEILLMLFWNIYLSSSRILSWLCQTLARRARNTSTLPSLNYRWWLLILWWSTCWWISQVPYPLLWYLQILDHATMVWDLRWNLNPNQTSKSPITKEFSHISSVPTGIQVLHTSLLPVLSFCFRCMQFRNFGCVNLHDIFVLMCCESGEGDIYSVRHNCWK